MDKEKSKKNLMVALGAVCIIIAITADWIGIGQVQIFGYKQLALLVVGLALVYFGIKGCKFCEKK